MATKAYVVSMTTGVPVQFSSALGGDVDRPLAALWMQPRGSNSAIIYIGTKATMTSTDYGVRLEIPVSNIPQAPFNPGEFAGSLEAFRSPLKMSQFWGLGATGDHIHILAIDY